ncbi:unnamed protein product [Albugo candida]|uniref:Uncharacterized protein n=1 Tax=Albugo candida TaxID=65357 RepID=A0A024G7W2_9STRA|nr:unnamed protein product [Albugo candida]|eukprot:CCI42941.1 unnamed protein product [Albugo candida]
MVSHQRPSIVVDFGRKERGIVTFHLRGNHGNNDLIQASEDRLHYFVAIRKYLKVLAHHLQHFLPKLTMKMKKHLCKNDRFITRFRISPEQDLYLRLFETLGKLMTESIGSTFSTRCFYPVLLNGVKLFQAQDRAILCWMRQLQQRTISSKTFCINWHRFFHLSFLFA